ncbi:MAG: hypothetical protein ACE5R4_10315 [Armatimonadota bacterium]
MAAGHLDKPETYTRLVEDSDVRRGVERLVKHLTKALQEIDQRLEALGSPTPDADESKGPAFEWLESE